MRRVAALDGLRGCAILLVLVWHYIPCQIPFVHSALALKALNRGLSLTWTGVELFFVLSGYLIGGILLDQRESPKLFRAFYARRTLRIFPVYFLVLGLFIAFSGPIDRTSHWLVGSHIPMWSYATFTQNIAMACAYSFGGSWLAMTWSLAVEEQFYLCLPLLIRYVSRLRLVALFVLLIVCAPLLRVVLSPTAAYVSMPARCDSLVLGVLIAIGTRTPSVCRRLVQHTRRLYYAFIAMGIGVLALSLTEMGVIALSFTRYRVIGSLLYTYMAVFYALLLLLVTLEPAGWLARAAAHRLLVFFGGISYAVYMFHEPVSGLLHGFVFRRAPSVASTSAVAITALSAVVTVALATLSHRTFEKWFLSFGQRIHY